MKGKISYMAIPGIKRSLMPSEVETASEKSTRIIETVCDYFKVTRNQFKFKSNNHETTRMRNIIWFFLKKYAPEMGNRRIISSVTLHDHNHSSVTAGVEAVKNDEDIIRIEKLLSHEAQ